MKHLKVFFKTFLAVFVIMAISFTLYGYSLYQRTLKEYPIEQTVSSLQNRIDYIPIEEISPTFLDAIVAIEDHRFYEHGAIDVISLTRAVIANVTSGDIEQGGSTITQQLAKNLFLNRDQTLERKVKEMFIAYELEKHYSKSDILELYVNAIYYGDGNTGIYAASKNYFGKTPRNLNFDEATLLAGLPQAPSYYALSTGYEAAQSRQQQVILALINFSDQYIDLASAYNF